VLVCCPALQDAARTEFFPKFGVLRIVRVLRLFLGVQMIEVAEELVETMHGGEVLVPVTKMVLTELPGGVAEAFQEFGDCRVFKGETQFCAWETHLRETSSDGLLPRDESRPTGGATLLRVERIELCALVGDPVDVGREIAHKAIVVATGIKP